MMFDTVKALSRVYFYVGTVLYLSAGIYVAYHQGRLDIPFDYKIGGLKTPYQTQKWVLGHVRYDSNYNLHWGDTTPDQAMTLAKSLYSSFYDGWYNATCGQFAGFYVVAARTHGYSCGGVFVYVSNPQREGHAMGWIVEGDGSITITSNAIIIPMAFASEKEFRASMTTFAKITPGAVVMFVDEKFRLVSVVRGSGNSSNVPYTKLSDIIYK